LAGKPNWGRDRNGGDLTRSKLGGKSNLRSSPDGRFAPGLNDLVIRFDFRRPSFAAKGGGFDAIIVSTVVPRRRCFSSCGVTRRIVGRLASAYWQGMASLISVRHAGHESRFFMSGKDSILFGWSPSENDGRLRSRSRNPTSPVQSVCTLPSNHGTEAVWVRKLQTVDWQAHRRCGTLSSVAIVFSRWADFRGRSVRFGGDDVSKTRSWSQLPKFRRGQTRSYQEIAVAGSTRTVRCGGAAIARNRSRSSCPAHRVIASGGQTDRVLPAGLDRKRFLVGARNQGRECTGCSPQGRVVFLFAFFAAIRRGGSGGPVWSVDRRPTGGGFCRIECSVIFAGGVFNKIRIACSDTFDGGWGRRVHFRNEYKKMFEIVGRLRRASEQSAHPSPAMTRRVRLCGVGLGDCHRCVADQTPGKTSARA